MYKIYNANLTDSLEYGDNEKATLTQMINAIYTPTTIDDEMLTES